MKSNKERKVVFQNPQKTALRNELAQSKAAFLTAGNAVRVLPAGTAKKF